MNSVISAFKTKKNNNNNNNNNNNHHHHNHHQQQQQPSHGNSGLGGANVDINYSEKPQQQQQQNNQNNNTNNINHHHHHHQQHQRNYQQGVSASSIKKKIASPSIGAQTRVPGAMNGQDNNGYQYLRHIREIDTATKILSPVMMAADDRLVVESNDPMLNCAQCSPTVTTDVVDHATNSNMNGGYNVSVKNEMPYIENGICQMANDSTISQHMNTSSSSSSQLSSSHVVEGDDDESEHSAAACTSSSSEHSYSTVLHSPAQQKQQSSNGNGMPIGEQLSISSVVSQSKSLNLSLKNNALLASSCNSVSAIGSSSLESSLTDSPRSVTPSPPISLSSTPSSPTPSMQSISQSSSTDANDYVPAFLKTTPITLPIIMPNGSSGLASMPPSMHNLSGSVNIMPSNYYGTTPNNSAANTPKHARYSKPRLSLSRFINHSMPSVHGRLCLSVPSETNVNHCENGQNSSLNNPSKRMSTHQRNLSLDFRSMGILLPPVSQVTNTHTNLTQHHRNRSLDSALQKIPEVEVSSPNAEQQDNTFCTPSILGTTMCSKIVTNAAANVTAALTTTTTNIISSATVPQPLALMSMAIDHGEQIKDTTTISPTNELSLNKTNKNKSVIQQQQQHNINATSTNCIVFGVEPHPLRMRLLPTNSATTVNDIRNCPIQLNNNTNTTNGSKKREDLTSLGSDDSGIICGSESDQLSLNCIRHSHESLDSGEMDAEEESMDMLETASMDEEYGMLQSDLTFYQTPDTDCRTLRPSRKKSPRSSSSGTTNNNGHENNNHSMMGDGDNQNKMQPLNDRSLSILTPKTPTTPAVILSPTAIKSSEIVNSSTESSKNEVLFKNFFGATKNAIFRTAQSIIENHEKKNAAKALKNEESNTSFESNSTIMDSNATTPTTVALSSELTTTTTTPALDATITSITTTTTTGTTSPLLSTISSNCNDVSKKKEFFSLLTSNSSKKAAAAAAAAKAAASKTPTPSLDEFAATAGEGHSVQSTSVAAIAVETCREKILNLHLPNLSTTMVAALTPTPTPTTNNDYNIMGKTLSKNSMHHKVPGVVKCLIKEAQKSTPHVNSNNNNNNQWLAHNIEKGPSGLLRFFESPVFNIHFAVHYLFYSKEPGVLSFIGNKIFSFPNQEVDLYIPQLIIMYIQMDELADVLDPYLTIRCRKSVDFSLKCLWLLEAYNYQVESSTSSLRKPQLALMREIFSKKERKVLNKSELKEALLAPVTKKTHHRSQSDATVLLTDVAGLSISNRLYQQPPYTTQTLPLSTSKLCLGDLTSGRAFDSGCTCFETVRGQVNGLLGHKTVCVCGAPKTSPQKEFMKALINVGKNLTSLPSKAEKTSALRMFLNLINKNLPARVWLPLYSDIPHHVVRITEEKTAVLNSKDKTPYIIYVEVVEVPDIYSSPVIQKLMPSLRHTKSEEHLELGALQINLLSNEKRQQQSSIKQNNNNHNNNTRTNSAITHIIPKNHVQSSRERKEKNISESSDVANSVVTDAEMLQVLSSLQLHEDNVWSQEDDEITAQYMNRHKLSERDAVSQMSLESCDSRDQGYPVLFNIGDVRKRHCTNLNCENTKSFSNDPEDPSAAALKEPWHEKVQQIRQSSPYGHLSNWRLLSAIIKCGDDLRQELMATQLLQMFKIIWQEEQVDLWVRPYKIVCLSNDSGLIEPILNTVSLHQIKKNSNKSLRDYFIDEYGETDTEGFRVAQRNFVQSCAAYCLISYLLQVKDRHNGNILLHSDGHIIHIDFGFILSISPRNLGFEQSPFKLTPEFVEVMGGTSSEHWKEFNRLLLVGMMSARKHMDRIINFVEIMRSNAQLPCFRNGCSTTVQNLRKRFHMNFTEQEMERKVEQLVQDSLKSLSTKLYDGYQYYTNGIL